MKAYGGYIDEPSVIKECASGGLATSMYQKVLKDGGIAYGTVYTDGFKSAQYVRCDKLNEIYKFRSSKYIKVNLSNEVKKQIAEDIKSGNKVLFIGIACDTVKIKNMVKSLGLNDENVIYVDLVCNGPADPEIAVQFVDLLEKRYKSKIKSFNARYKNGEWGIPYLRVEFESGKVFLEKLYNTYYGIAFENMCDEVCYHCPYKGEDHKSDIVIGNLNGLNKKHPFYNKLGVSFAVTNTDGGDEFLKSLDNFRLFRFDEKKLFDGTVRDRSEEQIKENLRFKENFKKYGLKKAVHKQLGIKGTIRMKLL